MHPPRVLIADDHAPFAETLKQLLTRDFQLVGIVADGRALIDAARQLHPDVIVADVLMPGVDGLNAMREIKREQPDTKVILLTNYQDAHLARHALRAGASGFVLKVYATQDLVDAINASVDGRTFVSSAVAS